MALFALIFAVGLFVGGAVVVARLGRAVPEPRPIEAEDDDPDEDLPDDIVLATSPFTCFAALVKVRCCAMHPWHNLWTALDHEGDSVGHASDNAMVADTIAERLLVMIRESLLPEEIEYQREERERREQMS